MVTAAGADWSSGYVTELAYTYGYYPELSPQRIAWALLRAGYAPPPVANACELGFGQGVSFNIHAAGGAAQWWGNDFNPAQAGFAQTMAVAAGSGAHITDESFAEFRARKDLPQFDYVCLHGIYSWVSAENRAEIVGFLRERLRLGGVAYISYNMAPGWAPMVPVRRLMSEHARVMGAPGHGLLARVDATMAFMKRVVDANPSYGKANPQLAARLEQLRSHDRHYMAHEYFNHEWRPASFCDLANELDAAKLSFAGSAHYLDQVDALNLTGPQLDILREIPDVHFRETVRDFMTNQQFRRDYWIKGARKLAPWEQREALLDQSVILTTSRGDVALKARGAQGEAVLNEKIYVPLLDLLADHRAHRVRDLEKALAPHKVELMQLLEALTVLQGKGDVAPLQSEQAQAAAEPRCRQLNDWILARAHAGGDIQVLVSPVIGAGVQTPRFAQLFLRARKAGGKNPREWAQHVWAILSAQGQRLTKGDKPLESAEDNLAELTKQAEAFGTKLLPILQALRVI